MPQIDALKTRIEETKKQIEAEGKAALQADFKEFFEKNPTIEALRWSQYTPYFNDGDACVFSVNDPTIKVQGVEGGGDYDDGFSDVRYWGEGIPDADKATHEFWKQVSSDEIFQTVFGDHAQVTATREAITVEEYSHD